MWLTVSKDFWFCFGNGFVLETVYICISQNGLPWWIRLMNCLLRKQLKIKSTLVSNTIIIMYFCREFYLILNHRFQKQQNSSFQGV